MKQRHDLWQSRNPSDFCSRISAMGVDLGSIVKNLSKSPDDTSLLVVGSIAEGLGNAESDVDLLLLVENESVLDTDAHADWSFTTGEPYKPATVKYFPNGVELDIEICVLDMATPLKQSTDRLLQFMQRPSESYGIPKLQFLEHRFLHQLRRGWSASNDTVAAKWRANFNVEYLHVYSIASNYIEYMELLEDVNSARRKGDLLDVANVGRVCAEYGAQALLGLAGETNPTRKWIAHLLRNMGDGDSSTLALTRQAISVLFPQSNMSADDADKYVNDLKFFGDNLRTAINSHTSLGKVLDSLFTKLHYLM